MAKMEKIRRKNAAIAAIDMFAKNPNILTPAQEKLLREQGLLFGEDDVLEDDVLEGDTIESDDILED